MELALEILSGRYAVTKLSGFLEIPALLNCGASNAPFPMLFSISATDNEISLVAPEFLPVPEFESREEGFRALRVAGTLDFGLVGILAKLTGLLAEEKIPVFVVSTYDTDYLLIRAEDFGRAIRAFSGSGAEVVADGAAGDSDGGTDGAAGGKNADDSEPGSVGVKKRSKR